MVTTACITNEHVLFNPICQMVPICYGPWAHVSLPIKSMSVGLAIFAVLTLKLNSQNPMLSFLMGHTSPFQWGIWTPSNT